MDKEFFQIIPQLKGEVVAIIALAVSLVMQASSSLMQAKSSLKQSKEMKNLAIAIQGLVTHSEKKDEKVDRMIEKIQIATEYNIELVKTHHDWTKEIVKKLKEQYA